ncbi:MAG: YdiU family protein [Sinobacteraceae bacterium]|nr:YdiU family protein [Nevskiaceae bacterium]
MHGVYLDRFVAELPGDHSGDPQPRAVPGVCYSLVQPTPVRDAQLLAWNAALAQQLGFDALAPEVSCLQVLVGNAVAPGMRPYAARYGGHQFGNWAGQLGDGRAITLGELRLPDGSVRELQLKGAGQTPYSRFADGRAVLRSSLREYLCSEAMHALGVPTTRALSLLGTGEGVVRDMFYDGRPESEPGAIVCRVAPSFVRFGNFEIHAALQEHDPLRRLLEWVIRHHFPQFAPGAADVADSRRYADWFREVCERTAVMVAHWMRVGFVHGVMNTDNMSVLGLTIDYGPYGWLEGYEPGWTPNTTDASGRRYCYGNQPQIALWNLARLASALMPLVEDKAALQDGLEHYRATFAAQHQRLFAAKLGLPSLDRPEDEALLADLLRLLQVAETDMTLFFRALGNLDGRAAVALASYSPDALDAQQAAQWDAWFARYAQRAAEEGEAPEVRRERMNAHNPIYVPRNYLAQQAIDAATQGDLDPLHALLRVLERPYTEQAGCEAFAAKRPEWARHKPGCSALSCSS